MEFLLNRYRNLAVLLVAILVQLALLAYQARTNQDVRLIRVWSVAAVAPLAKVIEAGRSGTFHFFRDYFVLLGVREENRKIKADLERTEMENQYLRAQLSTAENAKTLRIFQASSESKTVAAHVIANTTDTGANVLIDRGSSDGVQKGMAVVTPAGIVGEVISVFSKASFVLLVIDPTFAAGVVSEKHHVHGTLKGHDYGTVTVEHVQNEQTVDQGEWFLTSGDDGIFPRGTPVGQVTIVREGRNQKEIYVTPSGLQNGLEDVLVIVNGVHGAIPDTPPVDQPVHLLAPPGPDESSADAPAQSGAHQTDLDRVVQEKRAAAASQGQVYGEKNTPAPDSNLPPKNPDPSHPPPHP
ncbi:MAG TPA: rod shape-determining protein MreC [Bryobacteraceae bacterium]|jgi:rod shape-determining protein MreC